MTSITYLGLSLDTKNTPQIHKYKLFYQFTHY